MATLECGWMVLVRGAGCTAVLPSPHAESATSDWVAPVNSWPSGTPPAGLVGEGFSVGQVAPDVRLYDQNGQEVSLWQFYGRVVILDISTMWCGPCRQLAQEICAVQADYGEEGFTYLTLLPEDEPGEVPNQDELNSWVDDWGVTCAPVMADDQGYSDALVPDGQYPTLALIGRDMVVLNTRLTPAEDSTIRAAIESAL